MKQRILFALGATLVLLGAGCQTTTNTDTNYNSSSPATHTSSTATDARGTVIFSVTNSASSPNGIAAIYLTIERVEMHSPAKGWVLVSDKAKQYELLGLKNNNSLALAAQANLAEGTYNKVRARIKKVEVIKSRVRSEARLPSSTIELDGQFRVLQNATTSIALDFLVDQSLHVAISGAFIFTPVVKTEARANTSVVISKGSVIYTGGMVDTSAIMGMDLEGIMRDNFVLDAKNRIEIKAGSIALVGTSTLQADADIGMQIPESDR